MTKLPRGICSICKRDYALTSDSNRNSFKIRKHHRRGVECPGSGQAPATTLPQTNEKTDNPPQWNSEKINAEEAFLKGSTVRYIPRNLIPATARSFAGALQKVVESPESPEAWYELLQWPKRTLLAPTGKHSRAERMHILRDQITGNKPAEESQLIRKVCTSKNDSVARAVRIRIDAGDPKGAVRILLNDGRIVQPDEQTLIQLRSKHPTEPDPDPATTDLATPMRLTSEQLREAIHSTPHGGAPGPDGLRPCHLKQICGPSAGGEQENIMTWLLAFCNVCIAGKVPPGACSLFFGAGLVAFRKKDGGLRPIAVGLVCRRLISRAVCKVLRERTAELLAPI